MKTKALKSSLPLVAFVACLSACGGGDDDASGAPGELSLTPTAMGFQFGGTTCTPTATFPGRTVVLINGGAGSYSVATTAPDSIVIGPVEKVNGVYQFSFTMAAGVGTCFPNPGVTIQVTDVRKNFATVKLTTAASAP
ncbi:hypothetical protein ACVNIS_19385 [Sphaerotilaceae bacterium SBD11-9]